MPAVTDPTLQTAALAALEAALNRALVLSPLAGAELAPFAGDVFALHCSAPRIDVYLHPGDGKLRLSGVHEGPVTTSISGSAADFADLARADDPAATLINGAIELEGDSAPLIELQKVLATLELDWEAPLVNTLGDVAGHQLAQLLRHAFSFGQRAAGSLNRQLEEFIHEEARLSPPRLELEDFYSDVRELGQRVDRLQSRTERLRRQLDKLRG
ncbi:MAG: SCP2 sterol-binding domain-containing protein [Halioglobus sp.]|nr:SCP2 sterol-binding domain-containing protein [Halioglobus sp.]